MSDQLDSPRYATPSGRATPSDEDVLAKIGTSQEDAGVRDPYARLAQFYGVDKHDPRLYKLAGKLMDKGFDPNEWLDGKTGQGSAPRQHAAGPVNPHGMAESDQTIPAEPPQEGGFIRDRMVAQHHMFEPEYLAAEARQIGRGVDKAAFGIPSHLIPSLREALAGTEENDRTLKPGIDTLAQVGATLLGPGALAARGAGALARPLIGLAARGGRLAGAAVGAAAGAASVPVVGGALEGGQALADTAFGEEQLSNIPGRMVAGARAASTPMNLALGTGLGAAGGYSQGVRGSNSQTGEDIRLREEFGGRSSLTKGAQGGAFDSELLAGRRGTSTEVQGLARDASDQVRGRLNERSRTNQRQYGERLDEARAAGMNNQQTDITDALTNAVDRIESNRELSVADRERLVGTINREFFEDPLVKPLWQQGRLRPNPEELNQLRKRWDAIAKTGQGGENRELRIVAEELRDVEDTTPFAGIKAPFAEESENLKRGHELLGMGKKTSTKPGDLATSKKGARTLRRQGENTALSGLEQKDVDEFLQRFPELKSEVYAPRLLAAKNRLTPSLTAEGGTLYSRIPGAGAGGVMGLVSRNLEPIEANIAYPAGRQMGRAAPYVGAVGNPLLDAYDEWQRRNEERAAAARGPR